MAKDLNLNAYRAEQALLVIDDYFTDIEMQLMKIEKETNPDKKETELKLLWYEMDRTHERLSVLLRYAIEETKQINAED